MAEKVETMCSKCGFRQDHKLGSHHGAYKFCPHDAEPMLRIWFEHKDLHGTEIILSKTSDDVYAGIGTHFRCGGIIKEFTSSDDKLVYACTKCYWRYKSLE